MRLKRYQRWCRAAALGALLLTGGCAGGYMDVSGFGGYPPAYTAYSPDYAPYYGYGGDAPDFAPVTLGLGAMLGGFGAGEWHGGGWHGGGWHGGDWHRGGFRGGHAMAFRGGGGGRMGGGGWHH